MWKGGMSGASGSFQASGLEFQLVFLSVFANLPLWGPGGLKMSPRWHVSALPVFNALALEEALLPGTSGTQGYPKHSPCGLWV